MPRMEAAARLLLAAVTGAYFYYLPAEALLLPLGLALAAVAAYVLATLLLGWRVFLGPLGLREVRAGLWLDIGGTLLVTLNDPYPVPPMLALVFLAVLGNGLQHGRRLFLEGMIGATAGLLLVLPFRQWVLLDGVPYPLLFALIAFLAGAYYAYVVVARIERLKARAEALGERDPLTRLYNRRAFDRAASYLLRVSERTGTPLVLMFADLDDFKAVNDRWGHEAGDRVLQTFAQLVEKHLRGADLAARYGGDEFVFMLVGTELPEAERVAERLKEQYLAWLAEQRMPGGVSFGLGQVPPGVLTLDDALRPVDGALYRAKARDGKGGMVTVGARPAGDA